MSDSTYTEEFEEFWKVYPRRMSKKTAFKAWQKYSPEQHRAAIADVEKRNRRKWWSSDPKKIAHPSTYLNQERWQDEWEADMTARSESGPSAPTREYKPIDTGPQMSKWKALANRVGMKWLRTVGGLGDDSIPIMIDELNAVVRDGENYFEEDYATALEAKDVAAQKRTVLDYTELLLTRLDKKFGRNVGPGMLRGAKAQRG